MNASSWPAVLVDPPWHQPAVMPTPSPRANEIGMPTWSAPRTVWPGYSRDDALAQARVLTVCAERWLHRGASEIRNWLVEHHAERVCARALCYIDASEAAALLVAHPHAFCDELEFIAPVVAHAGAVAALDYWIAHALAGTRRDRAFKLLPFYASPLMVPIVLDAYWRLDSLRDRARAWMQRFSDEALSALVPLALGASFAQLGLAGVAPPKSERPLRPAVDAVRWLARRGERERIIALGGALGFEAEVRELIDVHPLAGAHARTLIHTVGVLPHVSIGGQLLDDEMHRRFVELLDVTNWDGPTEDVRAITDVIDVASREQFARALLDAVEEHRGFRAACHLAADLPPIRVRLLEIVRNKLNAWMIDAMATCAVVERATPRGAGMLEVMGEIALSGTTRAQEKIANEALTRVAEALDVPRDTLDDRLVPRLGFADDGTQPFGDFLARLDGSLEVYLVARDGNARVKDLPPSAKKDKELTARFKALRSGARKVSSGLRRRAQQWMLARQRWDLADFRANVLGHPVLRELARGLVWGAFDGETRVLAQSFRVAEDGSFADEQDHVVSLPARALAGVVHPIELTDAALASWQELFTEYEVLPIFGQLTWPRFRLTEDERAATTLARLHGRIIEEARLPADFGYGGVYEGVWFNGPDAPLTPLGANSRRVTFERRMSNGLRAMVFFDPTPYSWKTRTIREIAVQRLGDLDWNVRRSWREVDPVDASEMLRELGEWLAP